MEWKAKDIETYLKEKEYIDTAVVPLIPVTAGENMKHTVEKGEFTQLLCLHLERQFKGRMLFFPPLAYFDDMDESHKESLMAQWEGKIKQSEFKYVFFITSDPVWQNIFEPDSASLLYVPSVPMEHMDEKYKLSIMEEQVKLLMKEIMRGWQA